MGQGASVRWSGRLVLILAMFCGLPALATTTLVGVVRDAAGKPVEGATVVLASSAAELQAMSSANGEFRFASVAPQSYRVRVLVAGKEWRAESDFAVQGGMMLQLVLSGTDQSLTVTATSAKADTKGSGGGTHVRTDRTRPTH